ncbi:MAG: DUF1624 domain-containing protein [Chlorobiota bacterium]|nr:MAG: DUF1624 domain-containing protein [Chlorobiota bacterium]
MRYDWLDYLRGIAALWMIEVHVVDVALHPRWHSAWWFPWLGLTHGFVAVAFLFCAGGAFAITLERKHAAYRRWERPLWNYLAKLGLLLVLGYWLHLPGFSLERTVHATQEELRRLADCDILQCIAASSLLALTIGIATERARLYRSIYAVLTVAIASLTPWVWEQRLDETLPLFLGAYIAPQPLSKFPLFPFAAYFFSGAVAVPLIRSWSQRAVWWLLIWSVVAAAGLLAVGFSSPKQWWHTSPEHVSFRLAGTVALLAVLILGAEHIDRWHMSSVLRLAGQQSLWIYVFHLLIVYGSVGGRGLSSIVGGTLDPAACTLLIGAVGLVTLASAWGWAQLKLAMPSIVRVVVGAVVAIGTLIFLFLPARYAALLSAEGGSAQLGGVAPVAARSDLLR